MIIWFEKAIDGALQPSIHCGLALPLVAFIRGSQREQSYYLIAFGCVFGWFQVRCGRTVMNSRSFGAVDGSDGRSGRCGSLALLVCVIDWIHQEKYKLSHYVFTNLPWFCNGTIRLCSILMTFRSFETKSGPIESSCRLGPTVPLLDFISKS